jgi:hypothetical protein
MDGDRANRASVSACDGGGADLATKACRPEGHGVFKPCESEGSQYLRKRRSGSVEFVSSIGHVIRHLPQRSSDLIGERQLWWSPPYTATALIVQSAMVTAFVRSILLLEEEEEEEDPGEFGSHRVRSSKIDDILTELQLEQLHEIEWRINAYSRASRRRIVRFRTLSIGGAALAGAVPVAVATNAPGWVSAVLGAGAALSQTVYGVLEDRKVALHQHRLAVSLSASVRRFRADLADFEVRRRLVAGRDGTSSAAHGDFVSNRLRRLVDEVGEIEAEGSEWILAHLERSGSQPHASA